MKVGNINYLLESVLLFGWEIEGEMIFTQIKISC